MLQYKLSDKKLAWGALALLVLAARGSSDDGGTAAEKALSASEPSVQVRTTPLDTQAGESRSGGLAVREFDPIGKGKV